MTAPKNNRPEYVLPLNTGTSLWLSVVTICVALLIGFGTYMVLQNYRYYEIMQEVRKGCADRDNRFATVAIQLIDGMSFTCSPYDLPEYISKQHKKANKAKKRRKGP